MRSTVQSTYKQAVFPSSPGQLPARSAKALVAGAASTAAAAEMPMKKRGGCMFAARWSLKRWFLVGYY